ncbi:hypothetical protein BDFB_015299 [Asbolus verrucosus]|uniref:Uncharacterized protein n=2 Tax=Asbolus verrucosus TaxID=1661398 RepID=A0A482VSF8_ASBVE|nr:hypothetical protein BDFB_015299 [Asbolus verrucosus]
MCGNILFKMPGMNSVRSFLMILSIMLIFATH